MRVSLPGEEWHEGLTDGSGVPDGVALVVWDTTEDPTDVGIEVVVPPYIGTAPGWPG